MLRSKNQSLIAGTSLDHRIALAGQMLRDDGSNSSIVVTDQNGSFTTRRQSNRQREIRSTGCTRQHHIERRALYKVTLCPDGTAVLLNNASADGQAQTSTTTLTCIGRFNLLETIEDAVELVSRNATPLIDHLEEDRVGCGIGMNAYRRCSWRELDSI